MSTSHYSPLIVFVWALSVAFETSLMPVLIWRKAWRENAAFISFIAFCCLRSYFLLYAEFVMDSRNAYFRILWGAYLPQSVLLIAIVLEVIKIVFRPYDTLPRGTLGTFAMATLTVTLLTVGFTVLFPGAQPSEWMTFLRAIDQGVSWILLGVFALILGFASVLGIPWNHRAYGIAVGFAVYLSVDVVTTTMIAQVGVSAGKDVWPIDVLAFLLACSEWTYTFVRSEVPCTMPTTEDVNRIAALLSQYVFVIESLEVKREPRATLRDKLAHFTLPSEER